MRRHAFLWTLLLASGFGVHMAQAQQSPGARPPMPATLSGGQDLTSLDYERPARLHPPEPLEVDRQIRAERQAQFNRHYPGTPSNSYASLPGDPNRAVQ